MKTFLNSIFILTIIIYVNDSLAQNLQLSSSYGSGIETGGKMVNDAHGNVYIFGIFTDSIKLSESIYVNAIGNFDCYVAKFDRYMHPLWIRSIGSSGAEGSGGISYFDGKIYLAGWYGAQTIIDNDTLIFNLDCISPGFIACIDTSGNFVKAKSFTKANNSISCFVNAIEVNQTGIAIAGKIKGQFDFGNGQTINTNLSGTEHDIFVARFDTSFVCDFALKANSTLGLQNGNDGANSLQIDTLGNIYVAGFFGSVGSLSNATLYFGTQTLTANGGFGFSDFFVTKIRPTGAVAWLRGSGGSLPDFITHICLENNTKLAVAGRYSDNSNVGGIALTPSPGDYSTFIGSLDSAGTGLSAFRVSNEALFQSLKKGADNYLYATDINNTSPATRFKIYKLLTDIGIIAVDSLIIMQAGNYAAGDLIPPSANCDELIINCGFNEFVKYQSDTLIQINYTQNLYDFFYGKYSMNGSLLTTPQINPLSNTTFCSNSSNININATNIINASNYLWQIIPSNAGIIYNNGNSASLNIDSTYAGIVKVVCQAVNFCQISNISDTLYLNINQAPIIYSISNTGFGSVESNISSAANYNWYLDNVLLNFANTPTINCIGDGVYTIVATNASCSDTLHNFISCIISNLNEIKNNVIKIYSNPFEENIIVNSNDFLKKEVEIVNSLGQLVYHNMFNNSQFIIKTNTFSKGIYFVNVKSTGINHQAKILIN
jgi:hypothetical protein